MNDAYRPGTSSGGQPNAYYHSLPDSQLISIYEGSAVNSPEYIAVMAELRSRGYSFDDPQPAPQPAQQHYQTPQPQQVPPYQQQMPPYQQQMPPYQQQMPPYQQQPYGSPMNRPVPMGNPPYSTGGTVAWQIGFFLLAAGLVILMLVGADQFGDMPEGTKIIVSIVLGMTIMSSGFIYSGVRHLVNLKHGFHTASAPAGYWLFAGFWLIATLYIMIRGIITVLPAFEYQAGLALLTLGVVIVFSLFPLVQFLIFAALAKHLAE